jgi:hypothetical protein
VKNHNSIPGIHVPGINPARKYLPEGGRRCQAGNRVVMLISGKNPEVLNSSGNQEKSGKPRKIRFSFSRIMPPVPPIDVSDN